MPVKSVSPKRAPPIGRWLFIACVAAYFVAGAAYLVLRHYLWPRLDDWRAGVVAELSATLGRPVSIARIGSGFEGPLPRLTLEDVTIAGDDGTPLLRVPRVVAVISARSLIAGELRLSMLQLDSPRVSVERIPGGRALRVAGIEVPLEGGGDGRALELLFAQRRIVVHDAAVTWSDPEHGVSQVFEGIDLKVGNVGRRHRGALLLPATAGAWRALSAGYEFYRTPRSAVADWRHWSGEAFAGVDALDWAALGALLPVTLPGPLAGGSADARGWITFEDGHLHEALARVNARDLAWREPLRAAQVSRLEVEAIARPEAGGGYALSVRRFDLQAGGGGSIAGLGEQQVRLDGAFAPVGARLSLAPLDLAPVLDFARQVWPEPAVARALAAVRARGRVSAASLRWEASQPADFEVSVDFEGLSLHYEPTSGAAGGASAPKIPWFENLSGEARITRQDGQIRVRAEHATLGFPGIFEDPAVGFDTLSADANWRLDDTGARPVLAVDIARVQFANADATGMVSGSYRHDATGPGFIDLTGKVERAQARSAGRYLPLQIPREVRDWVGNSVTAGQLSEGKVRLRGDLLNFPYRRPADGEFSVSARLADGRLAYSPGWPAIEHLQGNLLFERAGMLIAMKSGRVFDAVLSGTQAQLRDFNDPLLRIEGTGEGPAQDMIRFVNESPVATRIDDFTRDTVVRGDARLALKLELPLASLDQTRVAGTVLFRGNDLTLDQTMPPFSGVTGALDFSERGLALRAIDATFLGGPLRVDGETPQVGRFLIRGKGSIDADGMRSVIDNPITRTLSGSATYRATIDVRRRAASVLIESDLQGLGAAMPAPFDKPAQASWPLRVQTTAVAPGAPDERSPRDTIRVAIADRFKLELERERDPVTKRLLIRRGAFSIDAEPVLQDAGLSVSLNTARLDVDAWTTLLAHGEMRDASERASEEFGDGFSLMPSTVSAIAGEVRVGGKDFHDVVFGASRAGGFWRANIAAREVNGYFNWRDPAPGQRMGALSARFTRLEIPKARASEVESLLDTRPEDLPALDVVAEEFVLGERRLGSLSLKATHGGTAAAPTWSLDQLKITNPAATLDARGTWERRRGANERSTRLDFGLDMIDSGQLLAIYGMSDVLRGGPGRIAGTIRWDGSPLGIDYPSLTGKMSVQVGKGQFLKTDPGIAKLIGVLSLQSLPRRLTLDFSDIFSQGFAFDEIKGDVQIERGVAHTDPLSMRGVQARVALSGSASLAAETQSLKVLVRPELNAGLASLAYGAMVHPAIGLGTFLAQLVLRRPIEQLFSYEYEVTGSWADPQVIDRNRNRSPGPTGAAPASSNSVQPPSAVPPIAPTAAPPAASKPE